MFYFSQVTLKYLLIIIIFQMFRSIRMHKGCLKCVKRNTVTMSQQNKSFLSAEDLPQPTYFPVFGNKLNFLFTGQSGTRYK